ncbi:MAG: PBP1A family penicillin-binding protein [Gemmatimonadetes bacterium]|uniref:PBP1A family penicillin-binding protein n=1 Tax=Candidatus Kutchimonas denitrificans TaxID=3056748 RepID=A0AAE5CDB5_9BACT|nr:PBP1A family penicillin-binding protein [Gemmatimonadota bacterium]NIR75449.1 PBP1A family penicillin-binding protein [Candidatus Kutchimonas denitrificans]NIS01763.1 PBP1A family penicillin-binding protein [Gemmatimonadota bacterium]NIT67544.1 PBP1A family penicillin-binding protein [Gemmatimonadota bacterium]NIU53418.1 PBP1A family penicillin-binding protein [Gemmatimonadota bacterium]
MFEKQQRRISSPWRKRTRQAEDRTDAPAADRPGLLWRIVQGWRPWQTVALLVLLFLTTVGAGIAVGTWNRICLGDRCPSIAQITVWEPEESSKLYAADGSLIHEFFQQRRTVVALSDLPPYVPQAMVAIEDKRFYGHEGIDYLRFARATVEYFIYGPGRPGGSTITQQLARNQFTERIGFDVSPARKLREAKVARDIERLYSKEEILEAYLNQINYGHGWYGIETASQNYFGKPASQLNLPEAALLAALAKAPTRYSPILNPERALGRRNLVLDLMARQGYISWAEAEAAKAYPLPTSRARGRENQIAPYFVEWVRQMLDDRFGEDLYRAGFKIYTTLDLEMQAIADSALKAHLAFLESEVTDYEHMTYEEALKLPPDSIDWTQTPYLQGMFVAIDPKTGHVKSMIGGRDWNHSKFNRATQALRQTGSVFKPFVYTAAVANGFPISYVIYDAPLELDQYDPEGDSSWIWSPKNYTNRFHGPMTLRDALRRSVNVVTVKLSQEVGTETVAQTARRMGIRTPIPRVAASAIGAASVIPLQVAEAFTTYANLGVHVTPQPILRVEDKAGRLIYESETERDRVLDEQTAWIMLTVLRDVVNAGTAARIRRDYLAPEIPAAGKTGTTNDETDVWFVGFTPDLLAAVWIGLDDPTKIFPGAVGGGHAAPVWGAFMQRVYQNRPIPHPWERPGGLVYRTVDKLSGRLATDYCPLDAIYTEVYLPGTEPVEECDLHQPTPWGTDR